MAIKAPLVLSLNVGRVRQLGKEEAADPLEQPWTSAIFKDPVEGPVWLSASGLKGDERASPAGPHAGDMAVLGYSAEHYAGWREELKQPFLKPGAFGENLTISRLTEQEICIGDIYAIGEARLQVALPRGPCWKLNRRFKLADMVERVHRSDRYGWYMRVLAEGHVERGSFVVLEDRPHPDWAVARAYQVHQARESRREEAAALAACPALSEHWKGKLREAAAGK